MNIFESGVRLPTNGEWLDIPGSPFQVCAFDYDRVGDFHIRVRPGHTYVSTACQHGLHDQCRFFCKYCQDPCECSDCNHKEVRDAVS